MNLDDTSEFALSTQQSQHLEWRSFFDANQDVAAAYGVFGIPTIFVIDEKGKIQWIGHQFNDQLVAELVAKLK